MNLIDKQKLFPKLLCKLYAFLEEYGYEFTLGEAWRAPETAKKYAETGKGIENSLHCLRLAQDICLFKDKKYLTITSQYAHAGEFWEGLSTKDYECAWGGRFKDGNHFSIEHNGVR